jgi:hypothetical protein
MVVGANEPDARGTLKYFMGEIGLYVPSNLVGKEGFTNFIVTQEGHNFFKP